MLPICIALKIISTIENIFFILYVYYCHLNHLFCQILVVTPIHTCTCISTPRSVCVPWYQYQYKKNKTCINFYSVRPMKCCVHVLHVSQPSMFNTLETFPSPPTFYGLLFPQYEHVVQLPHLNGLHHHWFHPL